MAATPTPAPVNYTIPPPPSTTTAVGNVQVDPSQITGNTYVACPSGINTETISVTFSSTNAKDAVISFQCAGTTTQHTVEVK